MLVGLECARRLGLGLHQTRPSVQLNSVRWNRKPWWLGTARTKIFKIPVKKEQPLDEYQEMQRLTNNHRSYIRSLWLFQREEHQKLEAASRDHAKESTEEAEIGKLVEEIDRDNALVRSIRELALREEWKAMENDILVQKAAKELEELEQQLATEKIINFNLERLKHAIRANNLDEAIEKALSAPIDPNFAVDKTGNLFFGRLNSTQPTPRSEQA